MKWLRRKLQSRYVDRRVWPLWARWALPLERPLLLIVGRRGSGKSLLASKLLLGRMKLGEAVYANYDLAWGDEKCGGKAGRLFTLLDCITLRGCTMAIDEANGWLDSRSWSVIPTQVRGSWQMSRKAGVSFIFTAQHEARVDVTVRELVDFLLVCDRLPLFPKWLPVFRYHRTWLEEVGDIRAGRMSRASIYWASDEVLGSYDTAELLDMDMLDKLKAYQAAVRASKNPEEVFLDCEEVRPPVRWSDGVYERYTGRVWEVFDA